MSLRRKLLLGFGGMMAILITVGCLANLLVQRYSKTLETTLRENYDSVAYGQRLKDIIGELEADAQSSDEASYLSAKIVAPKLERFDEVLQQEKANVTLAGEGELVAQLESSWFSYRHKYWQICANRHVSSARVAYQRELLPLAKRLAGLAQKIMDLNLENIISVDGEIRKSSQVAQKTMLGLVTTGVVLAVFFTSVTSRAILRPIRVLTESAREIQRGHFNHVIAVESRDELGQLAATFNTMVAKLREYRRSDRARISRLQRTTQIALNTFPGIVAIVGLDGQVELANDAARLRFGLTPGTDLAKLEPRSLWQLFERVFATNLVVPTRGYDEAIAVVVGDSERFYMPQAVPILDADEQGLVGVTLVLTDVTEFRQLDMLKSNLLAVASDELKTPLATIRMVIHLLLEEKIGLLTPKQVELLLAARDDAYKLHVILERLLDVEQLESGRAFMEFAPVAAENLVRVAVDAFATAYRDRGVALETNVADDLPKVDADLSRIHHVFSNLLENALKYSTSGSRVVVSAQQQGACVRFAVQDFGCGIAKAALSHIFERFYRAPLQQAAKGAGLGLAIAREIVEAHGGKMDVSSSEGSGSTFGFTLRCHQEACGSPV